MALLQRPMNADNFFLVSNLDHWASRLRTGQLAVDHMPKDIHAAGDDPLRLCENGWQA